MRCSLALIFALCLVVTPLCAEEPDKPEAVAMFERLIRRIPPATDAHDVHKYIGKEFTFVFNGSNADGVGVQWTPFWISGRLYCIHCVQSKTPTITVYQIIDPDLNSEPFAQVAEKAFIQFRKSLRKQRGAARLFDLYAAVDHGARFEPNQLTYTQVYPDEPQRNEANR
jgi:hypothetical protein